MKTALLTASLLLSASLQAAPSKILFGSCAHQDKDMPILNTINSEQPEVFVFLGDNVYGDTENMSELKAKYEKLGKNSGFAKLRATTEVIATWDDHDFGENDAGGEYPMKNQSKQIMLDFWGEPKGSQRYQQEDGIYTSYMYGEGDKTVHIILLDLRYNRAPINSVSNLKYITSRKFKNMGPYSPSEDPNASMLGENQWKWFEKEMKKPATLKIIGSSLQLIPDFTGWEAWANFPKDRNRLFNLIKDEKINGVMFLSGDTHWGELSRYQKEMPYPLWEVTSSGLTEEWKEVSPNQHRVGEYTHKINYGYLDIDWDKQDPNINFGLKDVEGKVINSTEFSLSSISPFN